jgi:hypothetical protein
MWKGSNGVRTDRGARPGADPRAWRCADILPSIVQLSKAHYRDTGEDIFPSQIAVELHYLSKFGVDWQGRDKTPVEIAMLFNHLFSHGGYVLVDRNDNNMCRHCTEILLARTWCDA